MERARRVKKPEHVTWKPMGHDACVLLNLESGEYYTLNESATALWKLMVTGHPFGSVVDQFCLSFAADLNSVTQDLDEFANMLCANGLLCKLDDNAVAPENHEIPATTSGRKPYTKPQAQHHRAVQQVTSGSDDSYYTYGGHYWYPC